MLKNIVKKHINQFYKLIEQFYLSICTLITHKKSTKFSNQADNLLNWLTIKKIKVKNLIFKPFIYILKRRFLAMNKDSNTIYF